VWVARGWRGLAALLVAFATCLAPRLQVAAFEPAGVTVPDLVGRTAAEAKQLCVAAGLIPRFQVGKPAAAAADAFHIYATTPAASTTVPSGSTVVVTIYADVVVGGSPAPVPPPVSPPLPGGNGSAGRDAWLGIYTLELSQGERAALKITAPTGVVVVGIYPNSPAQAAGLRLGDTLLFVNQQPVVSLEQATEVIAVRPPSDPIDLIIQRHEGRRSVPITPTAPPRDLNSIARKLADSGLAWAQYEMACEHLLGGRTAQDAAQARAWMQKAAEQNLTVAQESLGNMLIAGIGGARDVEQGRQWLEKAATAGFIEGQYHLGMMYYQGQVLKRDIPAAVKWIRRAAESGHGASQLTLGCWFETMEPPDHDVALYWLQKAAANRVAEANAKIAVLYLNGWGVEKNEAQALRYFLAAANAGDVPSQYVAGVFTRNGTGTPADLAGALQWFQKAAANGEPRAQNELGLMYQSGRGVTADQVEAAKWFRLAAKNGNHVAEYNMALLTAQSDDPSAAVGWYRRAAEHGLAEAQVKLGALYTKGEGVEPSRDQALLWYQRAALQGNAEAKESLRQLAVDSKTKPPSDGQ
jgi:TPR repeat protein